jgi:hypothetical protein
VGAKKDLPSSGTTERRIADFIKDYGPTFTLISVIVTSYWSYRALDLNASTSRAELYVRDIVLVVKSGEKATSDVGVLIINAGHKAAHLMKHRLMIVPGKIDGPNPIIDLSNTDEIDETIDHDHPLTFTLSIPKEAIPPLPPNTEANARTVYDGWMAQGQRLFLVGKMQYQDGIGVQWKDWCKYLAAESKWKTCPSGR